MNRDDLPSGLDVALAFGELMVLGRRTVAALPPDTVPAAAVAAVRDAVGQLWPKVTPEAARDVLVSAAKLACEHGVTELPAAVVDQYGARQLDGADGMLELTGEWIAAGRPAPSNGPFTPPIALASSVAFDRDEDAETLTSVAALLALSHLALAGQYARLEDAEPAEPEPSEDYDPGPEIDDEGGMSEYRYVLPDDPY